MKTTRTLALLFAAAGLTIAASFEGWANSSGAGATPGLGGLDEAAAVLRGLPAPVNGAALAAHATHEGHWRFANRKGEIYTAGTPEEMKRAVPTLAPEAPPGGTLAIHLSESTVFERGDMLDGLPHGAELHVVHGAKTYRLTREEAASPARWTASVRPNVSVALSDAADFREAVWRLSRPLDKARVRVLALEPGGSPALSSWPRFDPETRSAMVDAVDPDRVTGALGAVRGQTLLLTGRIEGGLLHARPASGGERSLQISELIRAAESADVDLVLLHSAAPRQPGGRNWFWQKVEVAGLNEALGKATFADFLGAVAGGSTSAVTVTRQNAERIVLRAAPSGSAGAPLTGIFGEWLDDMISGVTGNVVATAVEAHLMSEARQNELDMRLLPFIPSWAQFLFIAALVAGLAGLGVARGWWARLWPVEARADYANSAGYLAARASRLLAFLFVFLPLAGIPAAAVAVARKFWRAAPLPVRARRRAADRAAPGVG